VTIRTEDILTPANAVTLLGLGLTIVGAARLDTGLGFLLVVIGKLLDIADGRVARRTHTSRFGTVMDTTADKITSLVLLLSAYHFNLVPVAFLLFVFWQHLTVAAITVYATLSGVALRVTAVGRQNMFLNSLALFLLIATNFVGGLLQDLSFGLGAILVGVSIVYGISTILSYTHQAFAP
jgi:phosphatidylglycerophosphate synthase